jgi:hypothetical protein
MVAPVGNSVLVGSEQNKLRKHAVGHGCCGFVWHTAAEAPSGTRRQRSGMNTAQTNHKKNKKGAHGARRLVVGDNKAPVGHGSWGGYRKEVRVGHGGPPSPAAKAMRQIAHSTWGTAGRPPLQQGQWARSQLNVGHGKNNSARGARRVGGQ